MILFTKAQIETQTQRTNMDTKRGWDGLGDWDWHVYTMHKTGNSWEPTVGTGNSTQRSVVTQMGRKSKKIGDICIADSLCCRVEMNATLQKQLYFNKFF